MIVEGQCFLKTRISKQEKDHGGYSSTYECSWKHPHSKKQHKTSKQQATHNQF